MAVQKAVTFQRQQWQLDTETALREVANAGVEIIKVDTTLFKDQITTLHASFNGTPLAKTIQLIQEVSRD